MTNNILFTGGSGLLGMEMKKYLNFDAPRHSVMDITSPETLKGDYKTVIHAAAYTEVTMAEIEKEKCICINVVGTANMIKAFPDAYFVYISSEQVKIPTNFYLYTKLWGEEMVKLHKNYLIIRTLFKPNPFPYERAFIDQYTCGDYVDVIVPLIIKEILRKTNGTIDIGTGRKTIYELAKRTVPNIKTISVDDIKNVKLPHDYL
jgi:dTDP-4-dehydrorhamnose reductase